MKILHARTRDEYAAEIERLSNAGDNVALDAECLQAATDWADDESFRAWVVSWAHACHLACRGRLIDEFLARFPRSPYPVRLACAEYLAEHGHLDKAANEARAWMHALADGEASLAARIELNPFIAEGVVRACCIVMAGHATVGARSYALRLGEHAQRLVGDAAPEVLEVATKMATDLRVELESPEFTSLDRQWEGFHRDGSNAEFLAALCTQARFPILARRVETLAAYFQKAPDFSMDDREFFLLVYQAESGEFVLA